MITEDYVSFETAKLLKEKGFNERTNMPHIDDYQRLVCYIPTLQMAMKWLREEKKLYVNVWADPKDAENDDFRTIYRMHVYDGTSNYGTREFSKYEEACETGIRYCLENLI